jgi:hypothetical protein
MAIMAADNPPAGGGINDVFPTWRKNNLRVCHVASPADGGGGAAKAKQEAAPRRLSSESTAPAPPTGDTSGIDGGHVGHRLRV